MSASAAYREFWQKLGRGEFDAGEYKRIGKDGREVWIQARYNPLMSGGKPYKIVKLASDVTAIKLKAADAEGKIAALSAGPGRHRVHAGRRNPDGERQFPRGHGLPARGDPRQAPQHVLRAGLCAAPKPISAFWKKLAAGQFVAEEIHAHRQGRQGRLDPGIL